MKIQDYSWTITLQQALNIISNWYIVPVDENDKEIRTKFESELDEIADEMISEPERYRVIKIESNRYDSYVFVHVVNKKF